MNNTMETTWETNKEEGHCICLSERDITTVLCTQTTTVENSYKKLQISISGTVNKLLLNIGNKIIQSDLQCCTNLWVEGASSRGRKSIIRL